MREQFAEVQRLLHIGETTTKPTVRSSSLEIIFPSAPRRLKYLYLLLAVLLMSGLMFGTTFVCRHEDQKEEIICPEPIYVIEESSDWDKYPQSLIDNCPQIFEDWTGFDFEIPEFDE